MNLKTEQKVKFWMFIMAKVFAIILVIFKLIPFLASKKTDKIDLEKHIENQTSTKQSMDSFFLNNDSISNFSKKPLISNSIQKIENSKDMPVDKRIIGEANIINAPLVTNDVVLSMLLNKGLVDEKSVDWKKNAEFHVERGKKYKKRNDIESKELVFQFIFPKENTKNNFGILIDNYRGWILENSKIQTKSISTIIKPSRIKYGKEEIMINLNKLKSISFAENNLKILLETKKIDPKLTSMMVTDSPGFMGNYVFEDDKEFIKVNTEDIKKPIHELNWKIEFQVDDIEMTYFNDFKYLFYYIKPIAIHYKHPMETIWKTKKDFLVQNEWENELRVSNLVRIQTSKAFFNYDVLITTLLSNHLIDLDKINWRYFASRSFSNASSDKTKNIYYGYPKILSDEFYEVYKRPVQYPNGVIDSYKKWIIDNSDDKPKSIYQPISKLEKTEINESDKIIYKFSLGGYIPVKYSRTSPIVEFKELDPKRVTVSNLEGSNNNLFFEKILLIYPEASSFNILLELSNKLKIEPYDFSKNWRVELKLKKVEFDNINNKGYVFCYVEPKSIHYKTYDGIWHVTDDFKIEAF